MTDLTRLRPHSFHKTLRMVQADRQAYLNLGDYANAAHMRNCEVALERLCNYNEPERWGRFVCVDWKEL